jgi:hypothetical protein
VVRRVERETERERKREMRDREREMRDRQRERGEGVGPQRQGSHYLSARIILESQALCPLA